eukprot:1230243-Pyramimonas_sp.AAC.1
MVRMGPVGLIRHMGPTGSRGLGAFIGLIGVIPVIELMGRIGVIGRIELEGLMGLEEGRERCRGEE